jgi:energy-coupling factor transporter ATP-binding protein EcfA2
VFECGFRSQQQGLHGDALTARVVEALAQVGLAGCERRSPHHLSHGEKSRVCLAGILACAPRILALDEPTSNLDPRGRREFKALLNRIPATKIIATHDLEMVELCPRAILMDHGTVIADGPPVTAQ